MLANYRSVRPTFQDIVSLVISNSFPDLWNFQFALNNHYGFFSCIHFLRQLHFNLDMRCCYQSNAKTSTSAAKKCSVRIPSTTLTSKRLAENDAKTSKRHPDVMHASRLTPFCVRHFLAPVSDAEIPVGYARKYHYQYGQGQQFSQYDVNAQWTLKSAYAYVL